MGVVDHFKRPKNRREFFVPSQGQDDAMNACIIQH